MADKPKNAVEIFGVRPQVWAGLALAVVVMVFCSRTGDVEPEKSVIFSSSAKERKPTQISQIPSPAPLKPRQSFHAPAGNSTLEGAALLTETRETEAIPVLVNELFSPDPETRMIAAMRLSRRSVYASEAVPVLRKLARDEPDPVVRAVMKEAILNIRGYVPSPFMNSIPKK
jgi:hypothetical protein